MDGDSIPYDERGTQDLKYSFIREYLLIIFSTALNTCAWGGKVWRYISLFHVCKR